MGGIAVDLVGPPSHGSSHILPHIAGVAAHVLGLVDMVDGKTASAYEFVPALIVPALYEIILALGRGVVSQVSAVQPDRLELVGPRDKCLPLSDVEHVAVNGIVARRSLSVIVVVAADHQGGLGPCGVG